MYNAFSFTVFHLLLMSLSLSIMSHTRWYISRSTTHITCHMNNVNVISSRIHCVYNVHVHVMKNVQHMIRVQCSMLEIIINKYRIIIKGVVSALLLIHNVHVHADFRFCTTSTCMQYFPTYSIQLHRNVHTCTCT